MKRLSLLVSKASACSRTNVSKAASISPGLLAPRLIRFMPKARAESCVSLVSVSANAWFAGFTRKAIFFDAGDKLVQEFKALGRHGGLQSGEACDVAARMIEALNEADLNRIRSE